MIILWVWGVCNLRTEAQLQEIKLFHSHTFDVAQLQAAIFTTGREILKYAAREAHRVAALAPSWPTQLQLRIGAR